MPATSVRKMTFDTIEVRVGKFAVEWLHLDEGPGGRRLRPNDPTDVPCLRFVCKQMTSAGEHNKTFFSLPRGSYVTELPVTMPVDNLLVVSRRLIEILQECAALGESYQDRLALMAHLSPTNFDLNSQFMRWPNEALS